MGHSSYSVFPVFFLLLLWGSSLVQAQSRLDSTRVSLHLQQASLEEIFERLEAQSGLRFYYQSEELPQGPFHVEAENQPLSECLHRLLLPAGLDVVLYRDYALLIAPHTQLAQVNVAQYYRAYETLESEKAGNQLGDQLPAIGDIRQLSPSGVARLSGRVLDEDTGEPIAGARLVVDESQGTLTDAQGRYELPLGAGEHLLQLRFLGYEDFERRFRIYSDGTFDIALGRKILTLDEVVVEAEAADANVSDVQLGLTRIDVANMQKLPAFMGEVDLMQTLLLQAGVSTVGEGAGGFHVRGGNADQNLILLDEAFIFNATHALGFFSTFNADLLERATLYKGNLPATFGGRLASVLDVGLRDGNSQRYNFQGGIGPVSSRLSVEGPVIKGKSSFLAGLRASYSDWVLQLTNNPELKASKAFFYDLNARYTHRFSPKDQLSVSVYSTQDKFRYASNFGFEYATQIAQLSHQHLFSDKVSGKIAAVYSGYQSRQRELEPFNASVFDNAIQYGKLKLLLSWEPENGRSFQFGVSSILYHLDPGKLQPEGTLSLIKAKSLEQEQGLESAAFAQSDWAISPQLSVSAGLRWVLYQYLGPKTVLNYRQAEAPDLSQITDTLHYAAGSSIAQYSSLEPRLAIRWQTGSNASLKAGYSRTAQFLNQISNTTTPTPTQVWQLSTPYIAPQRSHNFSLGFFRNFSQNHWQTSLEAYYRLVDSWFDYKDFADIIANPHIETELAAGKGRAYGAEFTISKKQGRLSGWVSYTLSRTEKQVAGINEGQWYPANYDRPHDLSLVGTIAFTQRHSLTFNFNYRTGRPLTVPVGSYFVANGLNVPDYSLRNQFRLPDYHRLDVAFTVGRGYKKNRKFDTSWTLSVYNVYGRRNAYAIFFVHQALQRPQAQKLSILGNAFPALSFNFKLL